MSFSEDLTDEAVLRELGRRIARVRLDRNLTQPALAREAGVSKNTVERIESGTGITLTNFVRILRALGLLAEMGRVVPEPLISPIEAVDRAGTRRRRASGPREASAPPAAWSWADDDGSTP